MRMPGRNFYLWPLSQGVIHQSFHFENLALSAVWGAWGPRKAKIDAWRLQRGYCKHPGEDDGDLSQGG